MDLRYTVRRSAKRKRLTITVERDRSVVRARAGRHAGCSDRAGGGSQAAVDPGEGTARPEVPGGRRTRPGKELVNGESALYLGRSYRIELVKGDAGGVRLDRRFFVPVLPRAAGGAPQAHGGDRDAGTGTSPERRKHILPRAERHARSLGVRYGRVRIVDSRYRWGSCTVRGKRHHQLAADQGVGVSSSTTSSCTSSHT